MRKMLLFLTVVLSLALFGCANNGSVLVLGVGSDDLVEAVTKLADTVPTKNDAADIIEVAADRLQDQQKDEPVTEEENQPAEEVEPVPISYKSPSVLDGAKQSIVLQDGEKKVLKLLYIGVYNGGLSSWNDTQERSKFPRDFLLTVSGCFEDKHIVYNGLRYEEGNAKDLVIRPSESKWAAAGTAIMTRCSSKHAYLTYL